MSKVKKQIGDQVMITAGQFKNEAGKLIAKNRSGWTVELEDGQQVSVSFPMVVLLPVAEEPETPETIEEQHTENIDANSSAEADDASLNQAEPSNQSDLDSQAEEQQNKTQSESNSSGIPASAGENPHADITKMTVKQLQALARQRGIGIARTKSDFLRIIKEKNPDEDLDQLTGKTLFNRVSELHVSRLRTKTDLVRMLQDS